MVCSFVGLSSFAWRLSVAAQLVLNSTRWIILSMLSSNSSRTLMCGGGRLDLNPVSLLVL